MIRLAIPYFAWSAIYAASRWLAGAFVVPATLEGWLRLLFMGDAAAHLWFLPALIVCHVIGLVCGRAGGAVVAVLAMPFALLRFAGPEWAPFGYTAMRYTALGWVSLYLLGSFLRMVKPTLPPWAIRAAAVALPAVGALGFLMRDAWPPAWALMVASGTLLAVVVISELTTGADTLGLSRLGRLGPYGFGVYVVHMMPIYVAKGILGTDVLGSVFGLSGLLAAVVLLSVGFATAVTRTPLRRALLG